MIANDTFLGFDKRECGGGDAGDGIVGVIAVKGWVASWRIFWNMVFPISRGVVLSVFESWIDRTRWVFPLYLVLFLPTLLVDKEGCEGGFGKLC